MERGPVDECTGQCILGGSVDWGCNFLIFIKIDQSKMSHGKIASKGKMPLTAI